MVLRSVSAERTTRSMSAIREAASSARNPSASFTGSFRFRFRHREDGPASPAPGLEHPLGPGVRPPALARPHWRAAASGTSISTARHRVPARRRTCPWSRSPAWPQGRSTRSSAASRARYRRLFHLLLLHQLHRDFDEVPDHPVDVPLHVPDLGELRGLRIHEGRLGQPGQPPGDLGFPPRSVRRGLCSSAPSRRAAPRRPDAGASGSAARWPRPASRRLPHDVPVELGDDLPRRQVLGLHRPDLLDGEPIVGVDADLGGELHRLLGHRPRRKRRVGQQGPRRGERVGGA